MLQMRQAPCLSASLDNVKSFGKHTCMAGLVSDLKLRAFRVWFVDSGISCFKKIQYTNVNISQANEGVSVCITNEPCKMIHQRHLLCIYMYLLNK